MKKSFPILAFTGFLSLGVQSLGQAETILEEIQRTGVLKIGIRQDAPPFGYIDSSDKWTGYCFDLLSVLQRELGRELGREITLEAVQSTLANRFDLVSSQQVHLECGPNTIRNDLLEVTFSEHFFITGTQFLTRTQDEIFINIGNSVEGLKLGALRSSLTEQFLQENYPDAQVNYYEGSQGRFEGVQAIANQTLDAFASDGILLVGEVIRQGFNMDDYTLTPEKPLSCDFYGMILPPNDLAWQNTVNQFINSPDAQTVWRGWFTNLFPYLTLSAEYCADQ